MGLLYYNLQKGALKLSLREDLEPALEKRRKMATMKEKLSTVSYIDTSHRVTNISSTDMDSQDTRER